MKGDPKNLGFSTRAIHSGQAPDPRTGAVAVPIYQTSTYVQEALGHDTVYEYARGQNPTRDALEENVAALEGGLTGHAFASGMAAITAIMTLLEAGDHTVASRNVYGGTFRFFRHILERQNLTFTWVDSQDPEAVAAAMTENTRMVFVETPTNPLIEITDIAAISDIAHRHNALLTVDNTFLSPYLQRPIEHGADLVVHSTTKFLNGHSDSIGGVVVSADEKVSEWLYFNQKSSGGILSPFDSFLVMRGIKTLPVRMECHERNTRRIVDLLIDHPRVLKVLYPGLPDHPGHEIHKRQASGFGAMVTFDMGSYDEAKKVLDRVQVMSLAESLGGVETLISHPASMTHASVPEARRESIGLTDGLVRISVGLESIEDLLADLGQALG
ncbi:MAG: PLP-dependent aspartate aminotransferase family protein [Acidobacteriota bacterium]